MLTEDIFDHRTKVRQPFPLRGRGLDWLYASQLPLDVARRIRAAIKASRPRVQFTRTMVIVPCLVLINLVFSFVRMGPSRAWPLVTAFTAVALFPIAWMLAARFAGGPEIVWSFLAERRCPCCAYDLSVAPADPDGCTTCPECGAAWKISPPRTAQYPPSA